MADRTVNLVEEFEKAGQNPAQQRFSKWHERIENHSEETDYESWAKAIKDFADEHKEIFQCFDDSNEE